MIEQDEGAARLIRRKFEATKVRENLIREALERVERQLTTAQEELEDTVKNARREGYSVTWIAASAGVARGTVYKWLGSQEEELPW